MTTQSDADTQQLEDIQAAFDEILRQLGGKRAQFVREYVFGTHAGNGAQSAHAAGYAVKSARGQAARLLANADVARAIAAGQRVLMQRSGITADRVIEMYGRLAFYDLRKLATWDGDGNVSFTAAEDLADEDISAIAEITKETKTYGRDTEITTVKFKLHDRVKALDSLSRYFGLFNDKLTLIGGKVEEAVRAEAKAAGLSDEETEGAVEVAKRYLGLVKD